MPILYSFRRCPYAIRARMAIHDSGIQVELREVALTNKPHAMIDASPKATVPVLVLDDNTVIDESLDIMRWALKRNDANGWITAFSQTQQQKIFALINHNDTVFKQQLDKYKYADRYPAWPVEHYREQGEIFLQKLEVQLTKNRYLFCDQPSLADMAIFPFIRQFAHVDRIWFESTQYIHLQTWLASFLDSTSFSAVMKKFSVWDSGNKGVLF